MRNRALMLAALVTVSLAIPAQAVAKSCGHPCVINELTIQDANAAIARAKEAQKMAASVESEWRDLGKLLRKAEDAAAKGKIEEAIALAKKAETQGRLGYEQGMAQSELRIPEFFKPYMKK